MTADTARVVHVNDPEGFDVYIGRAMPRRRLAASVFANPYVIGRDGDREAVIVKYEAYVRQRPDIIAALPLLRGQRLGCWCKQPGVDVPCHGDTLLRLLEEFHGG